MVPAAVRSLSASEKTWLYKSDHLSGPRLCSCCCGLTARLTCHLDLGQCLTATWCDGDLGPRQATLLVHCAGVNRLCVWKGKIKVRRPRQCGHNWVVVGILGCISRNFDGSALSQTPNSPS